MTFDPFADDVQVDDVQEQPTVNENNDVWTENTDKRENTNVTVVNQTEGKVTVTLKGGEGFAAPWVVIHAENAQDALEQLNDKNMGELLKRVRQVSDFFVQSGGNASQRQSQNQPAQQSQRPPQQQAPNGETKTCQHGEMVFRSGVSKASGKPYKGFFCPSSDRNDQCKPQFIR